MTIWESMSQEVLGFQLWYWLVAIAIIIIVIWRLKPKKEKYKAINLKKENQKQFKQYFQDYSAKVKYFEKYLLRINYNKIGRIKRITEMNVPHKTRKRIKIERDEETILKEIKEGKKIKEWKIVTSAPSKFLCFEIYKDSIIWLPLFMLGLKKKYYLVDKELITREGNTFVIKTGSTFINFLGINIFSEKGKAQITDIAFKILREKELEELVNFTPRMIFLETSASRTAMRLREIADIEKKKYKSRQDRLIADETT